MSTGCALASSSTVTHISYKCMHIPVPEKRTPGCCREQIGPSQAMRTRQGPTARTLTALAWYMKVLPKRSRKDSRRWPRL